ncbi:tripartite motif-containing protein 40 [Octodon degus]|uniref:Tripartite motif-containing protein 40 n=1 Tax=Octodon degus TaxID=10160 RepID=A0A6P3FWF5_OCTDE|nr:tripartite motif-containing protein 40 [Octodon degus]
MVLPYKDSPEEGICAICQDLLKEAVSTDCGHLFCRACLAQHVEKASGDLCCPLCRKPCSEGVLGEGYLCHSHQKRVCRFCEEHKLLLCVECLESPEHQPHPEPTIKEAISHYRERLSRRSRKLKKDLAELQRLQAQQEEKPQALRLCALPWQGPDQLEAASAERAGTLSLWEAIAQLSNLVADLERTAKELDATTLKNASDVLSRSAPQNLDGLFPLLPPTGPAPR